MAMALVVVMGVTCDYGATYQKMNIQSKRAPEWVLELAPAIMRLGGLCVSANALETKTHTHIYIYKALLQKSSVV